MSGLEDRESAAQTEADQAERGGGQADNSHRRAQAAAGPGSL